MQENLFSRLYEDIVTKLKNGLSPDLEYHCIGHTLDVLEQAITIAHEEGIENYEDLLLLKISALYHDAGFLLIYNGHEEASCAFAIKELPAYGISDEQINKVCGMIRATNVPQYPNGIFEEIICDADLDYLGRFDFFEKGDLLYKEFLSQGIVSGFKEWDLLQIRFLENHHYFTNYSKQLREKQKLIHLNLIRKRAGI